MADNQSAASKGGHEGGHNAAHNAAQEGAQIEASKPGSAPGSVEEVSTDVLAKIHQAIKEGATIVNVAGLDVDAETAKQNFQSALKILQEKLHVNKNDLYFKQFEGETVGEAHEGKIEIDPIMLMHPAVRLAHVIAHEISHRGGAVDNDTVVEAFLQTLGFFENDGVTLSKKYTDALDKFPKFVDCVAGGETKKAVVEKLYKYYYTGEYEKIYELFEKNHLDTLKTDAEKDAAFVLFQEVFPELEVTSGKFRTDNLTAEAMGKYDLNSEVREEN